MTRNLVKPMAGILTGRTDLLDRVLGELLPRFGKAEIIGDWQAFDHTDYYADEMGDNLFRCFVSFAKLVSPHISAEFKAWTKEIEDRFGSDGRRLVNIDPGYLDANKVVLITGKHGGHKIALAPDVWADFLLWYNKGWVALPWAFPDFRDGSFFPLFAKMRRRFKQQILTEFPS